MVVFSFFVLVSERDGGFLLMSLPTRLLRHLLLGDLLDQALMLVLLSPTVGPQGSRDGFSPCPLSYKAFPPLWEALCPHGGVTCWSYLSFPSLPSHVRCRCDDLVSRVRPSRDHHYELRLLPVHGLDRLCPLPLRRLRHRLLLGGCPDVR